MIKVRAMMLAIVVVGLLVGCGDAAVPPTATPAPLAKELVLYNWADYMPQSVLDAFEQEYGVKVTYVTYESQEEAIDSIRAGNTYDVVVLENQFVPSLVKEGLLAEIDYRNVPNFQNVSPSFRDLAYDPANKHSIPYSWGTTALVIRADLIEEPITRWADLWRPEYQGKIGVREGVREPLGVALKSLGYSINTEDPAELEAALQQLLKLEGGLQFVPSTSPETIPLLESGEVTVLIGWAGDVLAGRDQGLDIAHIFPEEGILLWGDNFAIPTSSRNKATAELFLDFLLRPEISAELIDNNWYPTAVETAYTLVDPVIRGEEAIFVPEENLKNAEIMLPLSAEGEERHAEMWQRFMEGRP